MIRVHGDQALNGLRGEFVASRTSIMQMEQLVTPEMGQSLPLARYINSCAKLILVAGWFHQVYIFFSVANSAGNRRRKGSATLQGWVVEGGPGVSKS